MILSAYIHIPFCSHKCDFCDFVAFAGLTHLEDQYCQIVCEEIGKRLNKLDTSPKLTSIFYGGGTPGLIKPTNISKIHDQLLSHAGLVEGAEITLETTPQAITSTKARDWLALGINRLSVGVESFLDKELSVIGRDHNRQEAIHGLNDAVAAGFVNVNCDLMYGLPTQDIESWQSSLQDLIALAEQLKHIQHVSAYALDLAANSPLRMRFPEGSSAYTQDSEFVAMYEALVDRLEQAGFEQYEISNFSKPGFQSTHNLNYWNNSEYLAFGVGAHRYIGGYRSSNWRSLHRYMEDCLGTETNEFIDQPTRVKEGIMLGLRKLAGIDVASFADVYGINLVERFPKQISALQSGGFLQLCDGKLRLTSKGVPVSNSVIMQFI
jgi:oxygen-independent coproporphyrinogen-3 oxidase